MFQDRLKKLRAERGWTQAELAGQLGVSPSAVGMYEQGRREPDSVLLSKLASLFQVSTDYLLGHDGSQDVGAVIDHFTDILENQQGLMFHGAPLSAADREKIVSAIRVAAAIAAPPAALSPEKKK